MQKFTNQEKAKLYNDLLFKYQRIQEEVRRIKAENFELSAENQKRVNFLEEQMRRIYNDTQKLYN